MTNAAEEAFNGAREARRGADAIAHGQDVAVTGTHGGLRRFPLADRQATSDRATDPSTAAAASASGSKEKLIRDAVAAILRRQRTLDSGTSTASADGEPNGERKSALGHAMEALEKRLIADREARSIRAGRGSAELDPQAAEAFALLGRDLRRAVDTIDATTLTSGLLEHASPGDEASHPPHDLLGSAAKTPLPGAVPAFQSISWKAGAQNLGAVAAPTQALLGDIRGLLDRLGPGSPLDVLDRRVSELASKVERQIDTTSPLTLIEDMARRIDTIQASLGHAPGEADKLQALLRTSEVHLAEAGEASRDIQRLEQMVQGLATRIETFAAQPQPSEASALRGQIARLAERLERSDASLSSLDSVERNLRDVFSHLEQTRQAAIGAAEQAARTAARDTLREAINNPVVAAASEWRSGQAEDVAREVQDLKRMHDLSERRTQEAFAELHQAIEGLAERLERSESLHDRAADPASKPPRNQEAFGSMPFRDSSESDRGEGALAGPDVPARVQEPRRSVPFDDLASVDSLIEPGAAAPAGAPPDVPREPVKTAGRHRSEADAPPPINVAGSASFIAAARRAAQAAQASSIGMRDAAATREDTDSVTVPSLVASSKALLDRVLDYVALRRRPLLLGLAGLVLMLGAVEVARVDQEDPAVETRDVATESRPAALGAGQDLPADAPERPTIEANTSAPVKVPAPAEPPPSVPPAASPSSSPADASSARVAGTNRQAALPLATGNPFLTGLDTAIGGLGAGLKAAADGGDAAAQYEVALRYAEGRSVPRDAKEALAWFEKAASQGLAPAQYRLALAYEKGLGTARDPAAAVTWYTKAAEAGNVKAMHNLAVMSADGATGKPDYAQAAALFGKAAKLGVRDSQFNLAVLYARGLGIEQDLSWSYTWFSIAAAQGDEGAAKKRDDVATRLDATMLDAAKAAAAKFKPIASLPAANEVPTPSGGWDALPPPVSVSKAKTSPASAKGHVPRPAQAL